jgi:DNA-binding NarL/FixJ family response regulator
MDINLTEREKSILKELLLGKTYPEISRTLYITVSTIKHYMAQISEKFEVHGKVNILLYLIEHKELLEEVNQYCANKTYE